MSSKERIDYMRTRYGWATNVLYKMFVTGSCATLLFLGTCGKNVVVSQWDKLQLAEEGIKLDRKQHDSLDIRNIAQDHFNRSIADTVVQLQGIVEAHQ